MSDLINDYLRDPDTRKPSMNDQMSVSLTTIPVSIPKGVLHPKTFALCLNEESLRFSGQMALRR